MSLVVVTGGQIAIAAPGAITVYWNPHVPFDEPDFEFWKLYRRTGSATASDELLDGTIVANILQFEDTDVVVGQTYFYFVSTLHELVLGNHTPGPEETSLPTSFTVSATLTESGILTPPTILGAVSGTGKIILFWDDAARQSSAGARSRLIRGSLSENTHR